MYQAALGRGLITRALQSSEILAISPPLVISTTEIDELISKLTAALDEVLRRVRFIILKWRPQSRRLDQDADRLSLNHLVSQAAIVLWEIPQRIRKSATQNPMRTYNNKFRESKQVSNFINSSLSRNTC